MASHCPHCREPLAPDATACPRCRAPLPVVTCYHCGRASQPGDRFCGICGSPLSELRSTGPEPETRPGRWQVRILGIALGWFVCAVVLLLWWTSTGRRPAPTPESGEPAPAPASGAVSSSPQDPGSERILVDDLWGETGTGTRERDYTDREKIHQIAGRWVVETASGGQAAVTFTESVARQVREGDVTVTYYTASSRYFPDLYTVVRLPDGGNFLAFLRPDGQYGDVFENIAFRGDDGFSFRRRGSSGRFYAWRPGSARETPPAWSVPPDREARQDPERTAGEDRADDRATAVVRDPAETPRLADSPPRSPRELWRQAQRLRDEHHYHSLVPVLDALVAADPHHRPAREWRRSCDRWIRKQEEELAEDLKDRLEDLSEGISDRDRDEIFELWGDRPDAATRDYFESLLTRYRVLQARGRVRSVVVRDATATFTADVQIKGKTRKDRGVPFETVLDHSWRGQLRGERFIRPFP